NTSSRSGNGTRMLKIEGCIAVLFTGPRVSRSTGARIRVACAPWLTRETATDVPNCNEGRAVDSTLQKSTKISRSAPHVSRCAFMNCEYSRTSYCPQLEHPRRIARG